MNKKAKKLEPVDAAYIAALIDGEGSVMLTRVHKNEYRRVCISISNCDKKLLDWICNKIGIGKVHPKKIYNKKHAPTFFYKIVGREAISLLEHLENDEKVIKEVEEEKLLLE